MAGIIERIYKIVSSECDGCYIGSTTKHLNKRFSDHKAHYKRYVAGTQNYITSFEILKFVDAQIELIHEGVFTCKKDLEHLEGEIIQTTPNAVNKHVAGWTGTMQEYRQQYRHRNMEKLNMHYNTKHDCSRCGGKYMLRNKSRHVKSKTHQYAVTSSSSVVDTSDNDTEDDR